MSMAVEAPLNNVIFTVEYNLCHAGVIVPKISFFGMICPLLGGGGIAIRLKKIYIPRAIFEFPNPP